MQNNTDEGDKGAFLCFTTETLALVRVLAYSLREINSAVSQVCLFISSGTMQHFQAMIYQVLGITHM